MKKFTIKTVSLFTALILLCAVLAGCQFGDREQEKPPKLETPSVVIGYDGVAVWEADPHAPYYLYTVDGGPELPTGECSVPLSDGQTIRVKAVSGSAEYADSDFSEPQTYRKGEIGDDHVHSDVDGDGVCDRGGESVLKELSFYAVNDLHGKFMDTQSQPGLDEFTTYLKDLYADPAREEILLSSGDMWQGSVESSSNKGQLMTEWMNEAGFVSMTLGNHEFDWGPDILTPNSELAEFPFLAINVTYNGRAADYCKPSTVVERDGVKIGIIGAIGDCLSSISGEFQTGLSFATGSYLTALVQSEATRLREEGCDLIVYSIHDGGTGFSSSGVNTVTNSDMEWYDTALSNGYVDLVFEGHTHTRYILKDEYGVYHLQASSENRYISCADVTYNLVTGNFEVTPRMISSSAYSNADDDPCVEELFSKYFPDEDPYETVVGYNASRRSSDAIGDCLAELYYEIGMETWGGEYTIVAAGGMLKTRNPYDLSAGNVTYADLYSLLPFDNAIVLGEIRGSDLKRRILGSTSSSYHVYSAPGISSSSVKDSETYYIVVDTYTAYYSWNNIKEIARLDDRTYARDILASFLSGGGWA